MAVLTPALPPFTKARGATCRDTFVHSSSQMTGRPARRTFTWGQAETAWASAVVRRPV